jgi:hypothetical protein
MIRQFILQISETQPDLYLDKLKEELELEGIEISLASLCRYLAHNGITHKWVSRVIQTVTFASD